MSLPGKTFETRINYLVTGNHFRSRIFLSRSPLFMRDEKTLLKEKAKLRENLPLNPRSRTTRNFVSLSNFSANLRLFEKL